MRTLSGGQRTRLALATIMTTRPGCLLLDEPTNHLDDDAIEVLTGFLRELPGVVLLASHDRVLLDDVCTDLVDLDAGALGTDGAGGRRFGGGWSAYEAARAEARRRWEETYAVQQEELHRLRAGTRIGSDAIAHDRGPSDGDKFIYSFKGGAGRPDPGTSQEGRAPPPRGGRARPGAQAAGAAGLPRRPDHRRHRTARARARRRGRRPAPARPPRPRQRGSTCS